MLGEGIHRELELLVEAGLTPLEALSTATRNAGLLLKKDAWGTLAPGQCADLLLVRAGRTKSRGHTQCRDGRPGRPDHRPGGIAVRSGPRDAGLGAGVAVDR